MEDTKKPKNLSAEEFLKKTSEAARGSNKGRFSKIKNKIFGKSKEDLEEEKKKKRQDLIDEARKKAEESR